MSYLNWFVKQGWKNYWFAFLLLAFIDYCLIKDLRQVLDGPLVIVILTFITILSTHVGLTYHSIITYRKNKE